MPAPDEDFSDGPPSARGALPDTLEHARRQDASISESSDMSRTRATRAFLDDAYAAGLQMQKRVQLPIAGAAVTSTAFGMLLSFTPGERDTAVRQSGFLFMVVGVWLSSAAMLPSDRHLPRVLATFALAIEIIVSASDLHGSAAYVERWVQGTLIYPCPHYKFGSSISPEMCWWSAHIHYVRVLRSFADSIVGVCACCLLAYLLVRPTPARVLRRCYCSVVRILVLAYTLTNAADRLSQIIVGTFLVHNFRGPDAEKLRAANRGPLIAAHYRVYFVRLTLQLAICIYAMSPLGIRKLQAFLAARGHKVVLASAVSALIAGRSAEQVHREGLRSFRGIRAGALRPEHLQGGSVTVQPYEFSKPMDFGEVDAFVSHSVRRHSVVHPQRLRCCAAFLRAC